MTTQVLLAANTNGSSNSPTASDQESYAVALTTIVKLLAHPIVTADLAANDNCTPKEEVS